MVKRFLIDVTDPRFLLAANDDIIGYIRRANPFAHSDVGSRLFGLAKRIPGAYAYCPSTSSMAYVVLHTAADRIFALAASQRMLAFKLAASARAEAMQCAR